MKEGFGANLVVGESLPTQFVDALPRQCLQTRVDKREVVDAILDRRRFLSLVNDVRQSDAVGR